MSDSKQSTLRGGSMIDDVPERTTELHRVLAEINHTHGTHFSLGPARPAE